MKKMVIESSGGVEFVSGDYYVESIEYNSKKEVLNEFMVIMNNSFFGEKEYLNEIKGCLKNLNKVSGKWFIGYGDEGEVMVGVEN
jgi:hypothetical protein